MLLLHWRFRASPDNQHNKRTPAAQWRESAVAKRRLQRSGERSLQIAVERDGADGAGYDLAGGQLPVDLTATATFVTVPEVDPLASTGTIGCPVRPFRICLEVNRAKRRLWRGRTRMRARTEGARSARSRRRR
jgi:hypothetical protein